MEQPGHALLAEEAAVVLPFVVLGLDHGGGQAQEARGVGEDAHHLGPAIDLGVQPLDRVGAGDGTPVVGREGHVGEHVGLGVAEQLSSLGEAGLQQLKGVDSLASTARAARSASIASVFPRPARPRR